MTDVPILTVDWVLLDGMWFPVIAGTFDLQQAREWSTREGAFGWGSRSAPATIGSMGRCPA
ncbi:MAG TPA: hypothetical protein VF086_09555 [Propionibacteriaceae bacterium]